jgi:hypothetical protein
MENALTNVRRNNTLIATKHTGGVPYYPCVNYENCWINNVTYLCSNKLNFAPLLFFHQFKQKK